MCLEEEIFLFKSRTFFFGQCVRRYELSFLHEISCKTLQVISHAAVICIFTECGVHRVEFRAVWDGDGVNIVRSAVLPRLHSLAESLCVFIFILCDTEMEGGSWGGREEARAEMFGGGEQLYCIVRERQMRDERKGRGEAQLQTQTGWSVVHITCIRYCSYQHLLVFTEAE